MTWQTRKKKSLAHGLTPWAFHSLAKKQSQLGKQIRSIHRRTQETGLFSGSLVFIKLTI